MTAYLELQYSRREDNVPVTLVTELPRIRPLLVGGDPSELRLPGAPADAVYGRIVPTTRGFRLEPAGDGAEVRVNGTPLAAGGVELEPYHVIALENHRLTFHTGELPPEPPRVATHTRWEMLAAMDEGEFDLFEGEALSYVHEFELTLRPLQQAEQWPEVLTRVEAELQRLLRSGEDDVPHGYTEYLWWLRVRTARTVRSPRLDEIAREAFDLLPESRLVACACGVAFLVGRDWRAAADAFARVLRHGTRKALMAVHDARVGRLLVEQLREAPLAQAAVPLAQLERRDGEVARLRLHAPGDEVLVWRVAWQGRVFGSQEHVRFIYRGDAPEPDSDGCTHQHWEVCDMRRQVAWRWRIEIPPLPTADPSLVLEVEGLRKPLLSHAAFAAVLLERNEPPPEPPPVIFDASVLARLPRAAVKRAKWARLSDAGGRLQLEMVAAPGADDVACRQGSVGTAIAAGVAQRLGGSVLKYTPEGFQLHPVEGGPVRVHFRRVRVPRLSKLNLVLLLIAALALANALLQWLVRN